MYDRLYEFVDKLELLHPLQFGFREKHSTSHALDKNLLLRQLNIPLTIVNMVVEYF